MRRVLAEFALGIRLAFSGGRRGTARTAMAALGVAIGAATLLFAASVPVLLDARQARTEARLDSGPVDAEVPAGRTVIVAWVESQWGGDAVRGRLIWPDDPGAPLPPGVAGFPGDHQMYASPALQAALAGPDGDLLRRQVPYQVVGTIAPQGLSGPHEFAYYAGYPRVRSLVGTASWRVADFGRPTSDEPGPGTYVLLITLLVTLLLPVAIFIGAALRFGADARDRRLAAIRLIGADSRAVLRIALGESLVPSGLGLLAGTVLYLLARSRAADFRLFDVSVYPADIRPVPVLAAATVVVVLVLSAGLTLLGFRGVAVEPLGVFRNTAVWRGRLWWRLIPLAASLGLLYPVVTGATGVSEDRLGAGVVLLVLALVPLLPYLVPLVARLLPGGPVSWHLAAQQLRRNPVASTRAVTGIVVAVAGAVALHAFFDAAAVRRSTPDNPADASFILQAPGPQTPAAMRARSARFEQVGGVTAGTVAKYNLYDESGVLIVGDCAALSLLASLDRCADGDVFTAGPVPRSVVLEAGTREPRAGATVAVPERTRPATMVGFEAQNPQPSVLMTPAAATVVPAGAVPWFVETHLFTTEVPATVARQLRGIAAEIDPLAQFTAIAPEDDKYASLRTALDIGSALLLLLMGAGLLLDVTARLHDRRRLLGVLSAVGARRSTVLWSVLLQAIVPVLTGLALAAALGTGLGVLLMRIAAVPVRFGPSAVLAPVGTGAALVLLTTVVVLLPAVRRVTRTEELRYE